MDDIQNKIRQLEIEIDTLPIGYISRKNINGKIRLYHQWNENGKKKSKYVNDEVAEVLANLIAHRKELTKELKTLRLLLPVNTSEVKNTYENYITEIITGEQLRLFSSRSSNYNKRSLFDDIYSFLNSETDSKVLILYGLRRTGKTTLIQQALASLTPEQFNAAAFMQVRSGDTLAQVNQDLKLLQKRGYKYIFMDEVTLMSDFIEGAALFSDIYAACGMKLVLSGTDSLGFVFTSDNQLYDRCEMVHTTFIPYREFERVLGISGIDEYIRYGGTMSLGGVHYNEKSTFSNIKSTDEYVDNAIAKNIQHSLKYYQDAGHLRHLQDLFDNDELTSAINRVVEDINHRFTIDVLVRDFESHDLRISARNLRKDREEPTDALDKVDIKTINERLRQVLEIRNRSEQSVKIEDSHRIEIKEYLDLLDLTIDIAVESLPVVNDKSYMTVISQPGLRYSQVKELIRQLMLDETFKSISAVERKRIMERILDEVKGRIMEEIVLLETQKALPNKEIFKLKFAVGEFDMVIYDPENICCEIYEIKHSTEATSEQYRHLVDSRKCQDTEFRFGTINRKCVIYRGRTMFEGDIEYLNVEEYLNQLQ
ncbi:MAG: AAA family ATPase [Saccharofermentans sp.]|nr:AAA family ATPase [Saccharofermentans sp.]